MCAFAIWRQNSDSRATLIHRRELSEWNDDKLSPSAGARLYETEDGLNEDRTVGRKKWKDWDGIQLGAKEISIRFDENWTYSNTPTSHPPTPFALWSYSKCWACLLAERVLEAFKVISPVEAGYINELTLHQDQWWSSQGLKNYA